MLANSLLAPSGALVPLWPLLEGLDRELPPTLYKFEIISVIFRIVADSTYSSLSLPHLAHFPDLLTHGAHLLYSNLDHVLAAEQQCVRFTCILNGCYRNLI